MIFLQAANESPDRVTGFVELERTMGIEFTSEAWEAPVLPLNYARSLSLSVLRNCFSVQRFAKSLG